MTDWRPAASKERLQARAKLLQDIRTYFTAQGVLEVETPLISKAGNTDPEIQSMQTDNGGQTGNGGYLRTSPEFALKRLLAADSGDIYELGRVFRAAESGRFHNPEFTLLEWYRNGFSYHRLMDEVADLVRRCGQGKFDQWPEERLSYHDLFQRHIGIDPFTADIEALAASASRHGINDIELDHNQWLDLLISHIIQPALPLQCLTFVYDFPVDQAALAKIKPGTPPLAQRFELYLGRLELANGYQELTDATEQQRRFDAENTQRQEQAKPTYKVDQHFLNALNSGMPECAGVALGVDRLLMGIVAAESIDEVIAFPWSRA